jgi:hypothetical protein
VKALHWHGLPLAAAGLLLYGLVLGPIKSLPRPQEADVLRVVIPGYIEVLLAGGDRYLAANIGVFRSMMIGGDVKDELTYEVQAKVQRQVAILNPRQEDNSYVAAAILPWWGQVEDAQFILDRATQSRYWDFMPPFYQGFNEYYFNKSYQNAAELVELSASRTDGINRESFKAIAAKWYSLGDDPRAAIGVITALKDASNDPQIQRLLQGRIDRLKILLLLRQAAEKYAAEKGEPIGQLEQLTQGGYLPNIPNDPFGYGFHIDSDGLVQFNRRRKQ